MPAGTDGQTAARILPKHRVVGRRGGPFVRHGRKTVQLEKLLADWRKQLIARLRAEMTKEQSGSIVDPLLAMLAGLRRQRLEAEMTSRLLIAYGREFVRPRPYRLVDLADGRHASVKANCIYGVVSRESIKLA